MGNFFVVGGRPSEIGKEASRVQLSVCLQRNRLFLHLSPAELFRANFPRRRAFLPIFRHVALLARISNGDDDNVRLCATFFLFLAREGLSKMFTAPSTDLYNLGAER